MRERVGSRVGRVVLVALAGVGAAACDRADPRIEAAILSAYQVDPSLASQLCSFPVRGFSDVRVSQVRYPRGNPSGMGTAVVRAVPIVYAGRTTAQSCGGTIQFTYQLPAARARGMRPSPYYNSSTETVQVWNYEVLRRDAQQP